MDGLSRIRHSCAHVLATAVLRIWPEANLDIGPPTDEGFYYDFDLEHRCTPDDFEQIEAEMKKVVKENQTFEVSEMTREEAKAEYDLEPVIDPELLAMVKNRLGYDEDRWEELMDAPLRHYSEFPTYKSTFERLRPLFWLLYKMDRVPKTFYVKFCQPAA